MIDELLQAIKKSNEIAQKEKAKTTPAAEPFTPAASGGRGKIITIYSPRGGVGCTTLAANLAATLFRKDKPILVVDANLQFGDVADFFKTQGNHTLLDLVERADELDPGLVEKVVIRHESGIHLVAPPAPQSAERVRGDKFSQTLQYLSSRYAFIIMDTPQKISANLLSAMDISDLIVLVNTQDIPAIARMRKFLDLASLLELDPARMTAVVNQYDPQIHISPQKIGETLGVEIKAVIPVDKKVVTSTINKGVPLMLQQDLAALQVSQAIKQMGDAILEKLTEIEGMEMSSEEEG